MSILLTVPWDGSYFGLVTYAVYAILALVIAMGLREIYRLVKLLKSEREFESLFESLREDG